MDSSRPPTEIAYFDIETDGLLPDVSKIHCIVINGDRYNNQRGTKDSRRIPAALKRLQTAEIICGHNIIGYDIPVLEHLVPDWSTKANIIDTLTLARLVYPHIKQVDYGMGAKCRVQGQLRMKPQSLEAWGERLDMPKGDFGKHTDWKEWSYGMESYCAQDVVVTRHLHEHLVAKGFSQDAADLEMDLQTLVSHQERHGFLFDLEAGQKLYARLQAKRDGLVPQLQEDFPPIPAVLIGPHAGQVARMNRILDGWELDHESWQVAKIREDLQGEGIKFKWTKEQVFNPGSRQQVAARFIELGWEPTEMTDKGNIKVDDDVMIALGKRFPEGENLAEYALLNKRLGQIGDGKNAWLKLVQEDGRMRGRCNTMGTITYRFSHSRPNMGQVPNGHAPYGLECRGLFGVDDGMVLVGTDVSGAQLRMLGHYMARWDGGAYVERILEGDIHTHNQEMAGLDTRDQAKTLIYAFLFGAGDAKLGEIVGGGVAAGKRLRARFLKNLPALKMLQDRVRKQAGVNKKLTALDGRTLYVRSAHSAFNFLIQSAEAIVVKRATVIFASKLEELGLRRGIDWAMVAHVHDEFQTETKEEHGQTVGETAVQAIEEAGVYYNLRCPITGEWKLGRTWAETH